MVETSKSRRARRANHLLAAPVPLQVLVVDAATTMVVTGARLPGRVGVEVVRVVVTIEIITDHDLVVAVEVVPLVAYRRRLVGPPALLMRTVQGIEEEKDAVWTRVAGVVVVII